MKAHAVGRNPISCPPDTVWLDVAGGLESPDRIQALLQHAAGCQACAGRLRWAIAVMSDEIQTAEEPLLQQLEPRQNNRAAELGALMASRASVPRRTLWPVYGGLAAAAALLCAVWYWHSHRAPLGLLAQAYSERRTLELRVPGAHFAAMAVARGGDAGDRSLALLKSEEAIAGHSATGLEPDWLLAKGRAALLEWRYADAIQTLQIALDASAASPGRAETLIDLASAYFERAQKDNRAIDDSKAVELLGQAIQIDPRMAVAYFNRAIVEEQLFLYENALRDWDQYLKLDGAGPWPDDARRRQRELKRKMGAAQLDDPHRLDGLYETRFDRAMQQGVSGSDVQALAESAAAAHGDPWLREAAAASSAPEASQLGKLASARIALRVDGFPAEMSALSGMAPASAALQAWARYELLFRMVKSHHPAECVHAAGPAVDLARRRGYAWLLSQSLLEQAACDAFTGHAEMADQRVAEAGQIAGEHGFPALQLRVAGFRSSRLTQLGEYREANALQRQMLALFWSSPLPFGRAQQSYTDLMWSAEGLGRWHTAREAALMSAAMAERGGFLPTEAVVRARWAGAAARLGMAGEAREQAARSQALFAQLEPNAVTASYRAFAAAVSAQNAETRAALAALSRGQDLTVSTLVNATYWRALARFDLREARQDLAEAHLSSAVAMFAAGAETRRIGGNAHWRFAYESALRDLLLAKIERGDSEGAYWMWQQYLESADSHGDAGQPAVLATFLRLSGGTADGCGMAPRCGSPGWKAMPMRWRRAPAFMPRCAAIRPKRDRICAPPARA